MKSEFSRIRIIRRTRVQRGKDISSLILFRAFASPYYLLLLQVPIIVAFLFFADTRELIYRCTIHRIRMNSRDPETRLSTRRQTKRKHTTQRTRGSEKRSLMNNTAKYKDCETRIFSVAVHSKLLIVKGVRHAKV